MAGFRHFWPPKKKKNHEKAVLLLYQLLMSLSLSPWEVPSHTLLRHLTFVLRIVTLLRSNDVYQVRDKQISDRNRFLQDWSASGLFIVGHDSCPLCCIIFFELVVTAK